MPGKIEEFYVIRVNRKASDTHKAVTPEREVFISSNASFGAINKARAFDSIEAAEAYLAQRRDRDRYRFQIQYCTLFKPPQEDDPIKTITDELMQIPYPYRRTAYNWYRGRDVEMLLKRESAEVYQRHQKLLLDFGIDITTKSDIVLLGRTRKRKKSFSLPQTKTTSPRQYFAYPDQRPKPLAGQTHPAQRMNHKQTDKNR
jgi:NOL1/NOP2/fmu family ribosome biogenesis protein